MSFSDCLSELVSLLQTNDNYKNWDLNPEKCVGVTNTVNTLISLAGSQPPKLSLEDLNHLASLLPQFNDAAEFLDPETWNKVFAMIHSKLAELARPPTTVDESPSTDILWELHMLGRVQNSMVSRGITGPLERSCSTCHANLEQAIKLRENVLLCYSSEAWFTGDRPTIRVMETGALAVSNLYSPTRLCSIIGRALAISQDRQQVNELAVSARQNFGQHLQEAMEDIIGSANAALDSKEKTAQKANDLSFAQRNPETCLHKLVPTKKREGGSSAKYLDSGTRDQSRATASAPGVKEVIPITSQNLGMTLSRTGSAAMREDTTSKDPIIADLRAKFSTMELKDAVIETLKAEKDTLKAENDKLKSEKATLTKENDTRKAEGSSLKEENNMLKAEKDILKAFLDEEKVASNELAEQYVNERNEKEELAAALTPLEAGKTTQEIGDRSEAHGLDAEQGVELVASLPVVGVEDRNSSPRIESGLQELNLDTHASPALDSAMESGEQLWDNRFGSSEDESNIKNGILML